MCSLMFLEEGDSMGTVMLITSCPMCTSAVRGMAECCVVCFPGVAEDGCDDLGRVDCRNLWLILEKVGKLEPEPNTMGGPPEWPTPNVLAALELKGLDSAHARNDSGTITFSSGRLDKGVELVNGIGSPVVWCMLLVSLPECDGDRPPRLSACAKPTDKDGTGLDGCSIRARQSGGLSARLSRRSSFSGKEGTCTLSESATSLACSRTQWRKYIACPRVISVASDNTFLMKSDALFRILWLAIWYKWLTDF